MRQAAHVLAVEPDGLFPSEQRHKVLYRGPFPKGPDDKPFLGGDTVKGLLH